MQDFTRYDYTITPAQLADLLQAGKLSITVIINGEYYNLVEEKNG